MSNEWGRASPDPYLRWGDTVTLDFGSIFAPNGVQVLRREFARMTLPRPTLCQLNMAVRVQPKTGGTPVVDFAAINYTTGVGSSAVPTRRVYKGLPQVPTPTQPTGTPLDVSYQIPIQDLYGSVEAQAFDCVVSFTLWLAPISLEELGG